MVTRASSAEAGAPRYSAKVNWRRDLSDEVTREGWDYFNPLPLEPDYQTFPFPGGVDPIRLIHHSRRPNGESAVVVGTATTLWRFNTIMLGYVTGNYANDVLDGPGGSAQPYFAVPTRWQVIGSGFSPNGRRWEAVDSNGTTVFNNGVDLPQEFRVEYWGLRPMKELRDSGVLSVGTIWENNGILLAGDITELQEYDRQTVLGILSSGTITVSQAGFRRSGLTHATSNGATVTASASIFISGDVGRVLVWSDGRRQTITGFVNGTTVTVQSGTAVTAARSFWITDAAPSPSSPAYLVTASANFFSAWMEGKLISWEDGNARRIVKVISPTSAVVDVDRAIPAGKVTYENQRAYLGLDALQSEIATWRQAPLQADQRQYRMIWSELDAPSRFAVALKCSFEVDSNVILMETSNGSLAPGDAVVIDSAGANGGSLLTKITSVAPGAITIADPTKSAGTGSVMRQSSIGSTAGYEDLQDDGSGILKMATMQNRVIVYKDSNIFIGRYTGVPEKPFEFERVVVPHGRSLYFRNTLLSINGLVHFFAGRNRFYKFDLTSRTPEPIESADLVSDLFYDAARIADTEAIYAADNPLTQEVWIVCPASQTKVLAYDHVYSTFSTVDFAPSAAAPIKDPTAPLNRETSNWFLMGTSDGTILQYGMSDKPVPAWNNERAIWYRRQQRPYSATKQSLNALLSSGLVHFGDAYNEKHIASYNLQYSSLQVPGPIATVKFFAALNQNSPEFELGQRVISDDDSLGLVPLHTVTHYIRDQIETSTQKQIRLHMRTWEYRVIGSRSHYRK